MGGDEDSSLELVQYGILRLSWKNIMIKLEFRISFALSSRASVIKEIPVIASASRFADTNHRCLTVKYQDPLFLPFSVTDSLATPATFSPITIGKPESSAPTSKDGQ